MSPGQRPAVCCWNNDASYNSGVLRQLQFSMRDILSYSRGKNLIIWLSQHKAWIPADIITVLGSEAKLPSDSPPPPPCSQSTNFSSSEQTVKSPIGPVAPPPYIYCVHHAQAVTELNDKIRSDFIYAFMVVSVLRASSTWRSIKHYNTLNCTVNFKTNSLTYLMTGL